MENFQKQQLFDPSPYEKKYSIPREQVMEIRQSFDIIDDQDKGYIEPQQIRQTFQDVEVIDLQKNIHNNYQINQFKGDTYLLEKLYDFIDQDLQQIDFDTFLQISTDTYNDKSSYKYAQKVFDTFDKQGQGQIGQQELQEMSKILGENITEEQSQQLLQNADLDKKGYLTVQDFYNLLNGKMYWDQV